MRQRERERERERERVGQGDLIISHTADKIIVLFKRGKKGFTEQISEELSQIL
jgi:hypothetical protein